MMAKPTMRDRILASETLGVTIGAGKDEIRKAWKDAAFETHPDRGGCADAFATLSEAYRILMQTAPKGPTAKRRETPEPASAKRPARPSIKKRKEPIGSDAKARCMEILKALAVQGQVAVETRRTGRYVSYFFEDPAQAGPNHVSVDTGDLVRRDAPKPVHVEVDAAEGGCSTIELTEEKRREIFPGARRVRLHFAQPKEGVSQ